LKTKYSKASGVVPFSYEKSLSGIETTLIHTARLILSYLSVMKNPFQGLKPEFVQALERHSGEDSLSVMKNPFQGLKQGFPLLVEE
jgi:hypothetical protein